MFGSEHFLVLSVEFLVEFGLLAIVLLDPFQSLLESSSFVVLLVELINGVDFIGQALNQTVDFGVRILDWWSAMLESVVGYNYFRLFFGNVVDVFVSVRDEDGCWCSRAVSGVGCGVDDVSHHGVIQKLMQVRF